MDVLPQGGGIGDVGVCPEIAFVLLLCQKLRQCLLLGLYGEVAGVKLLILLLGLLLLAL